MNKVLLNFTKIVITMMIPCGVAWVVYGAYVDVATIFWRCVYIGVGSIAFIAVFMFALLLLPQTHK